MKVVILSDIHAAADAYEGALALARREGFDTLLILGDLLTYGPDPERTLALTADAVARDGAILISGNHDQLYQTPDESSVAYRARLPEWILDSVEWTAARTSLDALSRFDWQEEWEGPGVLAAHANPFGFRNWSYLRSDFDFECAAQVLGHRGFHLGIFGHTHRFMKRVIGEITVATIGSIGQPRDRAAPMPQWAVARFDGGRWSVEQRHLQYDWSSYQAAIRATSMSAGTKARICGFLP